MALIQWFNTPWRRTWLIAANKRLSRIFWNITLQMLPRNSSTSALKTNQSEVPVSLSCLFSVGAFILLETAKGSINHRLCIPLKPMAPTKLPNYGYSAEDAIEV